MDQCFLLMKSGLVQILIKFLAIMSLKVVSLCTMLVPKTTQPQPLDQFYKFRTRGTCEKDFLIQYFFLIK